MDNTAAFPWGPAFLAEDACPDVEQCRPACCRWCGRVAHDGLRLSLYGHGRRPRDVVVLPFGECARARLVSTWARRYRCCHCNRTCTVLPQGVLSRYLYTAWAIVVAWFLVEAEPVGAGVDDAEAYRRQGMYARSDWTAVSRYRWRSIGRWKSALQRRWAALVVGVSRWLIEVRQRGGSGRLQELVRLAVAHLGCGSEV